MMKNSPETAAVVHTAVIQTKAYRKYINRTTHYQADIELVDVIVRATRAGKLSTSGSHHIFDNVDGRSHPTLAMRGNSSGSRKNAVNHLRASMYAAFIKDLYEDALLYFSELLEAATRRGLDNNRLIGDHAEKFAARDLLAAGSWSAIVSMISKSVFRSLENERDSRKLLAKLNSKLNLGVRDPTISHALEYFEVRHLLVHADGQADEKFAAAYPGWNTKPGQNLNFEIGRLRTAYKTITDLVLEFDTKAVQSGAVLKSDCHP